MVLIKETPGRPMGRMEAETLSCPCGSPGPAVVAFRTATRQYCRCPACGLVHRSPRPSATAIQDYYREQYDDSYGRAEAGPDRGPVFDSVLAHLSEYRHPPGRLLDIGCGDGEFLVRCRAKGWTCAGLELSLEAAKRAAERGITMLPPDWLEDSSAASSGSGSYDVIALINVLETVFDPVILLARVYRALAPGGMVVIRVSNGRFHLAVRRPASWLGLRYQQAFHFFVYSPRALSSLAGLVGLEVLSVRNSRLSAAPLTLGNRPLRRGLWKTGGSVLWAVAEALYWMTGRRALWAPSFELIARRP